MCCLGVDFLTKFFFKILKWIFYENMKFSKQNQTKLNSIFR
jgi:hypothetical protein